MSVGKGREGKEKGAKAKQIATNTVASNFVDLIQYTTAKLYQYTLRGFPLFLSQIEAE